MGGWMDGGGVGDLAYSVFVHYYGSLFIFQCLSDAMGLK